ncbi:uncharacterized protein Z518_11047 [Rhinocladiella mackenziei CBS 650.93]|uniref:Heterokaryon incompatibility domain-containing protein n=1 Tax=Rhinocladiella mackenziei CBS 650.93 TaxID=1442369 RepID=A0A0D2ISB1_9EURO|nr:uncharacterized protein Z518_11047 [Rhinocladiella mackenziei CBS 650.93]KIW99634.1 hypothetical protein Z518_11047 [Rhinocladiella mackenziei CBS 650.93]
MTSLHPLQETQLAVGQQLCECCSPIEQHLDDLFGDKSWDGLASGYPVGLLDQKISNASRCPLCWQFDRGWSQLQDSNSSTTSPTGTAIIRGFPWAFLDDGSRGNITLEGQRWTTAFYRIQLICDDHQSRKILAELDGVKVPPDDKQLFQRRFLRPTVDIKLLNGWLSGCDQHEEPLQNGRLGQFADNCHESGIYEDNEYGGEELNFKLWNLKTRKLENYKTNRRYAALSYRWENNPEKKVRWELGDSPRTITDAAGLARDLGLDYLWVDRLCVKQDHENIKKATRQMHNIFGHAYVTIVACGDSAYDGLPGIGETKRDIREGISECSIRADVIQLAMARPALHTVVEATDWSDRAWTYQERLLSHRCLVFTKEEVFFSCPKNRDEFECHPEWRESYVLEDDSKPAFCRSYKPLSTTDQRRMDPIFAPRVSGKPSFERYAMHVERYTAKKLSKPEDIVAAFMGILVTLYKESLDGVDDHGLPYEHFQQALLWRQIRPGGRRRPGEGRQFPSWSWAGWTMPVMYEGGAFGSKCTPEENWNDRD